MLDRVCETLRDELKDTRVKVAVLCPGIVNTRLHETSALFAPQGVELGGHDKSVIGAFASAISPEDVGKLVTSAIEQDLFWIFTGQGVPHIVGAKSAEIADNHARLFASP